MVTAKITVEQAQQDKELMKQFVEQNIGLVKSSIKRLGLKITGDNFQDGCEGLIRAVKRFDPSRGTEFSTFAVPNIQGSIKRYYRDHGSTDIAGVKVPRELTELYSRSRKLESQGMTDEDICGQLGVSPEQLSEARQAMQPSASLDFKHYKEEDKETEEYELIPCDYDLAEEATENVFRQQFFDQLFDMLSERQALVLYWHLRGLSQEKVGEKVGITQVQVSRILQRIIKKGKLIAERRVNVGMKKPKITTDQLLDECREHGTDDEALQLIADRYGMTLGSVKQRVWKDKIKQKLQKDNELISAAKELQIDIERISAEQAFADNVLILKPKAWDGKECTYTFQDGRLIIANKGESTASAVTVQDFKTMFQEIKELLTIREVG